MWVFTNLGLISLVKAHDDEQLLIVRARRPEVLEQLFPGKKILVTESRDYKYRIPYVNRKDVAKIVAAQIVNINYGNFKASVNLDDRDLQDLYHQIWELHSRYQR